MPKSYYELIGGGISSDSLQKDVDNAIVNLQIDYRGKLPNHLLMAVEVLGNAEAREKYNQSLSSADLHKDYDIPTADRASTQALNDIVKYRPRGRGLTNTAGFIVKISGAAIGAVYLSGKNKEIFDQVLNAGSISNSANIILDTIKQAGELIAQNPGIGFLATAGYVIADQALSLKSNLIGKAIMIPVQIAKLVKNISSVSKEDRGMIEGTPNSVGK